jgi:hypothetical protein
MKPCTLRTVADVAVVAVELIAQALLLSVLLLLLIAGIEPTATAAADPVVSIAPAPAAAPVVAAPVAPAAPVATPVLRRTVADLRKEARAAGLPRSLYRSGNRAELLNALGLA